MLALALHRHLHFTHLLHIILFHYRHHQLHFLLLHHSLLSSTTIVPISVIVSIILIISPCLHQFLHLLIFPTIFIFLFFSMFSSPRLQHCLQIKLHCHYHRHCLCSRCQLLAQSSILASFSYLHHRLHFAQLHNKLDFLTHGCYPNTSSLLLL